MSAGTDVFINDEDESATADTFEGRGEVMLLGADLFNCLTDKSIGSSLEQVSPSVWLDMVSRVHCATDGHQVTVTKFTI